MMNETHLNQCQVFQIKPEEVISVNRKNGCELMVAWLLQPNGVCSTDFYLCAAWRCNSRAQRFVPHVINNRSAFALAVANKASDCNPV